MGMDVPSYSAICRVTGWSRYGWLVIITASRAKDTDSDAASCDDLEAYVDEAVLRFVKGITIDVPL